MKSNNFKKFCMVFLVLSMSLSLLNAGSLFAEAAPYLISLDPSEVVQGDLVTFSTTSSGPYKWWISEGPGNPCDWETDTEYSSASSFTYTFYQNGDWQVCLQVPDEFDPSGYYTEVQTVTVTNHEPEIGDQIGWTATPEPSYVGQSFNIVVPFTDYEDQTAFSCTIDYGDGTEAVSGTIEYDWDYVYNCIGPAHTYTTVNDFIMVTATIYDNYPDSSTMSEIYYHEVIAATAYLIVNATDDETTGACDASHCNLREAIVAAASGDTITFAESLSGQTITLTSTLTLTKNVTIDGSALASRITISGDNKVTVFEVESAVTATMNGLKIINGYTTSGGGAIENFGNLTIMNSILDNNHAVNYAGGIWVEGGSLSVVDSILSNNTSDGSGGGIYKIGTATVTVTNSTLSHNSASQGGGIYADWYGSVTVVGSTLEGNSATGTYGSGGGIVNWSNLTVANSTLVGNTAVQSGGGIFNFTDAANLTLTNNTLSGNSAGVGMGGGLANRIGVVNYANTIIANSQTGGDCVNLEGGQIVTNINNLVEDGSCSDEAVYPVSGDPLLAALADNGGSTQTMALLEGSGAIDAGDDTTCAGEDVAGVDQRGYVRPVGVSCDIGAYEYGAVAPSANLPPFAPNYYVQTWGWPSTYPNDSTFNFPVFDPEGYIESISYVSPTNYPDDFVVGVNVGPSCFSDHSCYANFYVQALHEFTPTVERMYITFDYRVSDGEYDSNTATVTLSFGQNIPYAYEIRQLAAKNETTKVRLEASGSAPLTFSIARQPENGWVGTPTEATCDHWSEEEDVYYQCEAEVDYTPDTDFEGEDSFDYVVFDGLAYSHQGFARLWIAPNSAPTATPGSATVSTIQPSAIMLEATDPDWIMETPEFWNMHDDLTFIIDNQPTYGTLGTPSYSECEGIPVDPANLDYDLYCRSSVIYTPTEGTEATSDSFTFHVNDSYHDSDPVTVTLTLRGPQTLTVNVVDDPVVGECDTHCSLREAVQDSLSGDTITFSFTSPTTITLTDNIQIYKSIAIVGPGADELSISGGWFDESSFDINDGGVFYLHGPYGGGSVEPISVSMSGLTIRDGRARYGGAISNQSGSTLTMTDCVIGPNNIVTDAGGGIANEYGDLILNRCTVVGNHGTGTIGGAGIFASDGGSVTLINSTVTESVTNNFGGGILAWFGGTVNLIHSTVSGNTSNANYDVPEEERGGGAGIYIDTATVNIQNSIVAGNTDMTDPTTAGHDKWPDVYGNVNDLGGNLIGDSTGSTGWDVSVLVGTADTPIDPMLDVLAWNTPGSTQTMALLAESPAIDKVTCPEGIDIDQRSVTRPQPVGGYCDIGAYELEQTASDTTPPELIITGATADSTDMAGNLETGYILQTANDPGLDHYIQFKSGTIASEPLQADYFGHYLSASTVSAADLKAYYDARGVPSSPYDFLGYLKDAADGLKPFVYIKGSSVTLVDAAKYDLMSTESDMTIPDDYPLGTYTVSGVIKDLAGNETTVTLILIVAGDRVPPVIDPHDDVTAEATTAAGAMVTYTSPTTSDAVDGPSTATCEPISDSQFALGDTTVTCNATDTAGNAATPTTFVVRVVDTTKPVIDPHDDVTAEATGADGAIVTYTSPATSDAVDGAGTATCQPVSGSQFALGDTTVTCSATDTAGNAATPTTFVVRVVDTTAPEVTVPSNMTVTAPDESGAIVTFSASAYDLVDGAITPTCDPLSDTQFSVGTTQVTCTATDTAGNLGSASFNVTVTYAAPVPLSQLTTTRTKCSAFASNTASDLERLVVTTAFNKKTGDYYIKKVAPSAFYYYVKALVPAEASAIIVSQTSDPYGYPYLLPTATLYDENCVPLSQSMATISTGPGNSVRIEFPAAASERIIYIGVSYSAKILSGFVIDSTFMGMSYTFEAAMEGTVFTSDELLVDYAP